MKKPHREPTTTSLVEHVLTNWARKFYGQALTQGALAVYVGRDSRQVGGALRWLLSVKRVERLGKRGSYRYRLSQRKRDLRVRTIPLINPERRPHGTGWRTARAHRVSK